LCGSQHGRAEVDGTSGLEVELELGLALPISVRLRDDFAPNVVGPEDRLLKLNFSQGLQEQEELAQPHFKGRTKNLVDFKRFQAMSVY
jgi:hypothetical protein